MKSILLAAMFITAVMAQNRDVPLMNSIRKNRNTQNADPNTCEASVKSCCDSNDQCKTSCSAAIIDPKHYTDFSFLSNDLIIRSYEYLFMSTQFGSHLKDRPGFEKVLHGLSNDAWNKGIEMIKEVSKRGAKHIFSLNHFGLGDTTEKINVLKASGNSAEHEATSKVEVGDVSEIVALAKAVEIEKSLLKQANNVHRHHSHAATGGDSNYDAGIAHYLQEEIIEEKTGQLRSLVGHVNDLRKMYETESDIYSLSLYLFDEQLQK